MDDKAGLGLTELLIEKRIQAQQTSLPPSQSLDELEKELEQLDPQVLDAYRESVIALEELKTQKEKILNRRKVLEAMKKPVPGQPESTEQAETTMTMLSRFQRVMAWADFSVREKLVNLLVNSVSPLSREGSNQGQYSSS